MATNSFEYPVLHRYFVSSNGERGFQGFFEKVFSPDSFSHIYIIQGGPGTGKSSMMRLIAQRATAEGAECEEILCSSDADSLDGVILEKNGKRVGVLDGTSPHVRVATLPGCKETLLNFGAFWQNEPLRREKERILWFNECKKESFSRAYSLLAAAGAVHRAAKRTLAPYFLTAKARKDALSKLRGRVEYGMGRYRYLRTYSMQGERRLPEIFSDQTVYAVLGNPISAEYYLKVLIDLLKERGIAHTVYLSPLSPDHADGVAIDGGNILLYKAELLSDSVSVAHTIRTARFLNDSYRRDEKRRMRLLQRNEDALISEALAFLHEASISHFALERIYGAAMDFEALTAHVLTRIPEMLAFLA